MTALADTRDWAESMLRVGWLYVKDFATGIGGFAVLALTLAAAIFAGLLAGGIVVTGWGNLAWLVITFLAWVGLYRHPAVNGPSKRLREAREARVESQIALAQAEGWTSGYEHATEFWKGMVANRSEDVNFWKQMYETERARNTQQ